MDIYFLKLQFLKGFRFFKTKPLAKIITALLFAVVFMLVAFGVYKFFSKGFAFFANTPYFAAAVSLYMYELFLLVIFIMLWCASVIAVIFSLFRNKEGTWLLATPKFLYVPYASYIKTVASSSWLLVLIMFPAVLAAVRVNKQSLLLTLVPIVSSLLFAAGCIALVFIFTLLVARIISLINRKLLNFASVSLVHLGTIFFLLSVLVSRFRHSDLIKVLYAEDLYINKAPLTLVHELYRVFPTHVLAKTFLAAQFGEVALMWKSFLLILGGVSILIFLAWLSLKLWFLPVWQALSENTSELVTPGKKKLGSLVLLRTPSRVVIYKELMSFTRSARNLSWFIFIGLLWFANVGAQNYLQNQIVRHNLVDTILPVIVTVLPLAILSYFTAALVLRFAFPSFSEERDTAWVFIVSPLKKSTIIWSKFLFYLLLFTLVTSLAQLLFLGVSVVPQFYAVEIYIASIVMTFFLTALGTSLGGAFPNFETSDPEVLSTSVPGLATVVISVGYGALVTYAFYLYITKHNTQFLTLILISSVMAGLLLIMASIKKSKQVEFITKRVS